eukprot:scaffold233_cov174-Ochromonas_danica.AAC.47
MKFGKQLQLGIYEQWRDYYIQYNKLKRIIKRRKFLADKAAEEQLKQQQQQQQQQGKGIVLPTSSSTTYATENTPLKPSVNGLPSSMPDYTENNAGLENGEDTELFPVLIEEMEKVNKFFIGKLAALRIALEEITVVRKNSYRTHHTSSDSPYLLQLRDIYVDLAALRSYCNLNRTGFYKIVKKYDKMMGENNLEAWMRTIDQQPFSNNSEPIQLMEIVTSLVSRDKLIEWERFATEQQLKSTDDIFPSVHFLGLLLSASVFIVSLSVPYIIPNDPAASRCLSLLLLVVCLWITEAIPYFATALLVPILVTVMGVLKDPNNASKLMSSEESATFVLDHIFNHTTMLLLGGYTISTAFSRCQLELRIASILQNRLGGNPRLWISNHTAPILCATIILPIVRDLPTDSRFSKALLLGLAYACNFGGMMTPIASLQNVLAVSHLEQAGIAVSFGRWICVSLPFCVICTLIAWFMIILLIEPNDLQSIPVIVYERNAVFTKRNVAVIALSLLTIILFAFFQAVRSTFGDIAIIALGFITMMFGTGMLSEVDFNSLSWHTLFLVGGGNVLGKAIASSGLLGYLSDAITQGLPLNDPWLSFVIILCFACGVATFVSHTVASLILMPIIASIGLSLEIPQVLVIGSAFAVSAAMGLPFSSFPNVNSLLIVDDFQKPYLSVQDFLKTGILLSAISVVLIGTLGYLLINLIISSPQPHSG